jgi:prepilin-type N-terminal cleavage/methylation domain-containing protein
MNANSSFARTLGGLRKSSRYQKGFSLLELGLTLLIVGILIGVAAIIFANNNRKVSINKNAQQLQLIAGTAKSNFGMRNLYGSVNTAVAVQGHIIPGELRDGTSATATNTFGAPITVTSLTTPGAGSPDALTLTWGSVPADQCSELVVSVADAFRRVTVAGTDVKPLDGSLNPVLLTTQCEASANVSISFVIGRS